VPILQTPTRLDTFGCGARSSAPIARIAYSEEAFPVHLDRKVVQGQISELVVPLDFPLLVWIQGVGPDPEQTGLHRPFQDDLQPRRRGLSGLPVEQIYAQPQRNYALGLPKAGHEPIECGSMDSWPWRTVFALR